MPAELSEADASRRVVDAIQRVRRQKQRLTAERIHRMLERNGDTVTSSEVDRLLDLAVYSGTVERIYNSSGIVSYKELANSSSALSSTVTPPKSSSDAVPDTYKPEPEPQTKNSELPVPLKEIRKVEKKVDKKPSSRSRSSQPSIVCQETVSADCKPVLVVDKHANLSDVVLQVILRLGCASGKAVEKDIRGHYRLDVYPGIDIRRVIRTACKSLVQQEQVRQEGNNFVLMGDDDDAADVTLTVDEPASAMNKSIETQVEVCRCMVIIRPHRCRSIAAYNRQTFPWTICGSVGRSVRASVGRSIYPVHCGKTADRIWMLFGIIDRTVHG